MSTSTVNLMRIMTLLKHLPTPTSAPYFPSSSHKSIVDPQWGSRSRSTTTNMSFLTPSLLFVSQRLLISRCYYCKSALFDDIGRMSKDVILLSGSAPLLTRLVLWGAHVDWDQSWLASAPNLVDLEFAWHPEHLRPSLS